MRDQFDISGVFETTEFEIAQVACIQFGQNFMFWARCNVFFSKLFFIDNYRSNINTVVYKD